MKAPAVSAIVPTIGPPKSVDHLLRSLAIQRYKLDEVIIADASNGSRVRRVSEDPQWAAAGLVVRRVVVRPPDAVRQRKEAIAIARGSHLLLLDDDVVLEPGCVEAMVDVIAQPGIVAVTADFSNQVSSGPTLLWRWYLRYGKRMTEGAWQGKVIGPLLRFGYRPSPARPMPMEWLGAGNSLVRRDAYDEAGGFSEFLLHRCTMNEDVALGLKLNRLGRIMLVPAARMAHMHAPAGRVTAAVAAEDDLHNRYMILRHTAGRSALSAFGSVCSTSPWKHWATLAERCGGSAPAASPPGSPGARGRWSAFSCRHASGRLRDDDRNARAGLVADLVLLKTLAAVPAALARHAMSLLRAHPALADQWGVHIRPVDYYDPLPDFRNITADATTRRRQSPAIDFNLPAQVSAVRRLGATYRSELEAINGSGAFNFQNDYFAGLDAAMYYALVRDLRAARVVEIGSGFSTRIADLALRRNRIDGHTGDLMCIEPFPQARLIDAELAMTLIEQPVEGVARHVRRAAGQRHPLHRLQPRREIRRRRMPRIPRDPAAAADRGVGPRARHLFSAGLPGALVDRPAPCVQRAVPCSRRSWPSIGSSRYGRRTTGCSSIIPASSRNCVRCRPAPAAIWAC